MSSDAEWLLCELRRKVLMATPTTGVPTMPLYATGVGYHERTKRLSVQGHVRWRKGTQGGRYEKKGGPKLPRSGLVQHTFS